MNNIPLNIDWQQILLHLFNFAVLFGVLFFLLYNPVKKFMESREEYFKNLEEKAKKNYEESEKAKDEYTNRLKECTDEVNSIKKKAMIEADEMANERIEEAQKKADKLIHDAKIGLEKEKEQYMNKAYKEIGDMVNDVAKRLSVNSDTQQVYDEFLKSVKRGDRHE